MAALVLKNTLKNHIAALKAGSDQSKIELKAVQSLLLNKVLSQSPSNQFESKLIKDAVKTISSIAVGEFFQADGAQLEREFIKAHGETSTDDDMLLTSLIHLFVKHGDDPRMINLLCQVYKDADDDRLSKLSRPVLITVQKLLNSEMH